MPDPSVPEPIVPLTVAATVLRMLHAGHGVEDIVDEVGYLLPAGVDPRRLVETFARERQAWGRVPISIGQTWTLPDREGVVLDVDQHRDPALDLVVLRTGTPPRRETVGRLYLEAHGIRGRYIPTSWERLLAEDTL